MVRQRYGLLVGFNTQALVGAAGGGSEASEASEVLVVFSGILSTASNNADALHSGERLLRKAESEESLSC